MENAELKKLVAEQAEITLSLRSRIAQLERPAAILPNRRKRRAFQKNGVRETRKIWCDSNNAERAASFDGKNLSAFDKRPLAGRRQALFVDAGFE